MTDVLARARDLMSKAAEEPWNGSLQKALTEKFQQLASAGGGDSVNDDGSVLAHFRNADNRAAYESPRPRRSPLVANFGMRHGHEAFANAARCIPLSFAGKVFLVSWQPCGFANKKMR
jgi:hypothetical protein